MPVPLMGSLNGGTNGIFSHISIRGGGTTTLEVSCANQNGRQFRSSLLPKRAQTVVLGLNKLGD